MPPARDPEHWLYRLDAAEWLAAADTELVAAADKLRGHSLRAGVTHCRRGAGMALNALLLYDLRPDWGRSYMEHVVALAQSSGDTTPAEVVEAAQRLRAAPTQAPPLVQLGRRGELDPTSAAVLDAARTIIGWVRARLAALAAAVN
ncbi:MAG TPA: hypothetical protein VGG33_23715 [Polyangia bacterium]